MFICSQYQHDWKKRKRKKQHSSVWLRPIYTLKYNNNNNNNNNSKAHLHNYCQLSIP